MLALVNSGSMIDTHNCPLLDVTMRSTCNCTARITPLDGFDAFNREVEPVCVKLRAIV